MCEAVSGLESEIITSKKRLSDSSEIEGCPWLESEDHAFDSDYYEDYYDDYDYEYYLPKRGHELKHGRIIANRGSNQQKFPFLRPKSLVKYGKCDIPSTYEFDEETQSIVRDYFLIKKDAVHSGERSFLLHYYGKQPEDMNAKPPEYVIKVYRPQFGVDRTANWAFNDYFNMRLMQKYANVPKNFAPNKNTIVMDFIGDDGVPAPSLNEVTCEITENMYTDIITSMYRMYNEGKRVHGNLSARTILWWREKLYFISFSRAVRSDDPNALRMLMKDCCNVTHFFKSKSVLKVKSIINLFKYITGLDHINPSVLQTLKHTRRKVKHRLKKKLYQDQENLDCHFCMN